MVSQTTTCSCCYSQTGKMPAAPAWVCSHHLHRSAALAVHKLSTGCPSHQAKMVAKHHHVLGRSCLNSITAAETNVLLRVLYLKSLRQSSAEQRLQHAAHLLPLPHNTLPLIPAPGTQIQSSSRNTFFHSLFPSSSFLASCTEQPCS